MEEERNWKKGDKRREKERKEVGWRAIKNESASWVQFRSSHRR